MANITIQVLDEDEQSVAGARVDVEVDGSMLEKGIGGHIGPAYTGEDGHASLETACDYPDYTKIDISVNGRWVQEERIGGGSFTVHLP